MYTKDTQSEQLPFCVVTVGTEYDQDAMVRPDGYMAHHLLCVEQGECIFEFAGKCLILGAGAVVFIPKDYPHSYRQHGDAPLKTGFVTFDGDCVEPLLKFYHAEPFRYCTSEGLQAMIAHCCRLAAKNASSAVLSQALYEILTVFFAELSRPKTSPILERAKEYIELHCQADLSVAQIAQEVGISSSLLFRLFREEEYTTPIDFLRHTRIRRAKQLLLQNPQIRIAELAAACGFSDCAYFCKVFKDLTGMTPKRFLAAYVP
ncbi:MAG: helix-turn-helix transcriptional regulator [Clostridia bacterium]|nr:helix-turn-helix transcriptional regulator [Clostridia bacterium]